MNAEEFNTVELKNNNGVLRVPQGLIFLLNLDEDFINRYPNYQKLAYMMGNWVHLMPPMSKDFIEKLRDMGINVKVNDEENIPDALPVPSWLVNRGTPFKSALLMFSPERGDVLLTDAGTVLITDTEAGLNPKVEIMAYERA